MNGDSSSEAFCCPTFDPKKWDGKEFTWKGKLFVKENVPNFFKCPPDFGETITKVKEAGALPEHMFMLFENTALWSSDVYVSVDKAIPEAEVVKISGKFMTKVFEGACEDSAKMIRNMENFVKSKGKTIKKSYFFYNLCGKCGKTYGKEYTAILAEV
ncbi:MAG: hydrolase [Candidatus Micrarchaeota archaeon]